MKTVFKYPLTLNGSVQKISMPVGSEILSVQQQQHGNLALWALVDDAREVADVRIRLFGTGFALDECNTYKFIGTVQLKDGGLVIHVFEVTS